jgi:hypothetical protein
MLISAVWLRIRKTPDIFAVPDITQKLAIPLELLAEILGHASVPDIYIEARDLHLRVNCIFRDTALASPLIYSQDIPVCCWVRVQCGSESKSRWQ